MNARRMTPSQAAVEREWLMRHRKRWAVQHAVAATHQRLAATAYRFATQPGAAKGVRVYWQASQELHATAARVLMGMTDND